MRLRSFTNRVTTRVRIVLLCILLFGIWLAVWPPAARAAESATAGQELEIDIVKKGLGKEVTIRRGAHEWFMLVEVTPENTVVVRQEKNNETYVVDESETHDRAMTAGEVDAAINDFVNSVKTQVKMK